MVGPIATDVGALPLAPRNPLSFRQRLKAVRETATGQVTLRDAGGPITRVTLGPRWLSPPIVWVMSPGGRTTFLPAGTIRVTGPPCIGRCAT